jgi:hypothetical protein
MRALSLNICFFSDNNTNSFSFLGNITPIQHLASLQVDMFKNLRPNELEKLADCLVEHGCVYIATSALFLESQESKTSSSVHYCKVTLVVWFHL